MSSTLSNVSASVPEDRNSLSTEILTLAVATILTILWWLFINGRKVSINGRIAPLPPGPRGLPVLGYLPFLGTHLHKEFTKLAETYGPIYKLRLGNKLLFVVSSASVAREIVRDQDAIFANRDAPIAAKAVMYGGADLAWIDYNPEWKKMRKMFVHEVMSNPNLDGCYGLRKQEVRKMVREVYNKIGSPVDVGELSFLMNINAVLSVLWGATFEGEEGTSAGMEYKKLMSEQMVLMGKPNISEFFPVLARFDLQGIERQGRKIFAAYDRFLDSAIRRCEEVIEASKKGTGQDSTETRKDVLRVLLELRGRGDGATSISMTQLKGLLADIVVGGSDTTSTMVEWTMAELMNHPEIMKKVHQELDQVVGLENNVEESHLPGLCYLEAVVKETLRLHPALPFLVPRRPSKTTQVAGYTVPENTTVYLNVYAIHRDPEFWESPLEFRPERFLSGEASKIDYSGNNHHYFPFGSGRRICAGLPLARKMLLYQVASLLHSFEWKLPAGSTMDLSDRFGLVVKKMEPTIGIPTPRLSNPDLSCM